MGVFSLSSPLRRGVLQFLSSMGHVCLRVWSLGCQTGIWQSPYRGKNGQQRRQCVNHAFIFDLFLFLAMFLHASVFSSGVGVVKRGVRVGVIDLGCCGE